MNDEDYVKVTDIALILNTVPSVVLHNAHREVERRFMRQGVEAIEGLSTGTKWMPGGGGLQAVVSRKLASLLLDKRETSPPG